MVKKKLRRETSTSLISGEELVYRWLHTNITKTE